MAATIERPSMHSVLAAKKVSSSSGNVPKKSPVIVLTWPKRKNIEKEREREKKMVTFSIINSKRFLNMQCGWSHLLLGTIP